MPITKIPLVLIPEIIAIRDRFGLSYKQLSDWLLRDKGIEVTGAAVSYRVKKYEKGLVKG